MFIYIYIYIYFFFFFCIFGTGYIKWCWVKWIRSTNGKYSNIILKDCGII